MGATTEIGCWVENKPKKNETKEEILELSYDLTPSDIIHDLYALIGSDRYEGKVFSKEVADRKCIDATANGRPCIKIQSSKAKIRDINIYRKFDYQLKIPANMAVKVWMRYSSIIFRQDDKFEYTVRHNRMNAKGA